MSTTEKNLVNYKCQKCHGLLIKSNMDKNGSVCSDCGQYTPIMIPNDVKRRNHAIVALKLVDGQRQRDGSWIIPGVPGAWVMVRRLTREVTSRKGIPPEHALCLDGCVIMQLRPLEKGEKP